MNHQPVQRWLFGRDQYRPAGETIAPRLFEVGVMLTDAEPKAFIERHHYAGTYPAARFRFGLYTAGRLVGVAVFSHPSNDRVLTRVFTDCPASAAVELGRFVLLDEVPGNGETWFLARCFAELRKLDLRGVVSFSDPMPRTTARGRRVFPGHIGTIYQAHNGGYYGRSTARTLRLMPDGTVLSARALSKLRNGERGWRYVVEQLQRAGAQAPGAQLEVRESRHAWLRAAVAGVTRPLIHPGNHRYAWVLNKRQTIGLRRQPYPKQLER